MGNIRSCHQPVRKMKLTVWLESNVSHVGTDSNIPTSTYKDARAGLLIEIHPSILIF